MAFSQYYAAVALPNALHRSASDLSTAVAFAQRDALSRRSRPLARGSPMGRLRRLRSAPQGGTRWDLPRL